jgi:hypothetical protein
MINETSIIQVHSQVGKRGIWLVLLATAVCIFLRALNVHNGVDATILIMFFRQHSAFPPPLAGQSGCILLQDHLEQALMCIAWTRCAPDQMDLSCPMSNANPNPNPDVIVHHLVGGGSIPERDNCEGTLWRVLAPLVVAHPQTCRGSAGPPWTFCLRPTTK